MSEPLSCQQVSPLLLPYLHEGLPPPQREAVARHLAGCPACRAELRETVSIERELRAEAARRSPKMDARVSARIQQRLYQQMRTGLIMKHTLRLFAVFAALVLVAVVVFEITRQVVGPAQPLPDAVPTRSEATGTRAAGTRISTPTAAALPPRHIDADAAPILPDTSHATTIVRAPLAWRVSTGQGVKVGVIQNHAEDLTLVKLVAPGAAAVPFQVDQQLLVSGQPLAQVLQQQGIHLLAVLQPGDFDSQALRGATRDLTAAGVTVFANADQTPGDDGVALVNDLQAAGAVTIGQMNATGEVLSEDILRRKIDLFAPVGWQPSLHYAALTAASVGALVVAEEPAIPPPALRQLLLDTADDTWQLADPVTGTWNPTNYHLDSTTGDYSPADAYRFRRINAASALGVTMDIPWPVNALNAPAAWQRATGKGVKVAIIDRGFHAANPAFKGHLVDKAAFAPGKDFDGGQDPQGTTMAKIVLSIAPDASLVFLLTDELDDAGTQEAYIKAIDYAIASHVQVISSSVYSWHRWATTPEVYAAVDRAVQAGIVFVWSEYGGSNPGVIRPGYYWSSFGDVGAFEGYLDPSKPADEESGLADTSPQIAAIAALILQNEPNLTPMQVRQRILETAAVLPNGCSLADAASAVTNHPSGRKVTWLGAPRPSGSQLSIVYAKPNQNEKTTYTWKDTAGVSPFPIFPGQNVLLYSFHDQRSINPIAILYASDGRGDYLFNMGLYPADPAAADSVKGRYISLNLNNQGYMLDLTKVEAQITVQSSGSHVKLHWENPDGALLQYNDPQTGSLTQSSLRLYSLDAEGDFLPMPVEFQSTY